MASFDTTPRGLVVSVSRDDLAREFEDYGRGTQFSRAAIDALHGYYSELAEDSGQPIQLDVIGICCDWGEYDDVAEACESYGCFDLEELEDSYRIIRVEGGGILVSG